MIKREEDIVIYAAGPMDFCTPEEAMGWRIELKKAWKGKILDPTRRTHLTMKDIKQIVTLDKLDITQADVVLANCWKAGWGTAMEIPYAFDSGKLVVIVFPDLYTREVSPWLAYHSHFVCSSMEMGIAFIRNYFEVFDDQGNAAAR